MRKMKLNYILISIGVGAAVGGIGTFVAKRLYEQKMLDEIDEKVKSEVEHYKKEVSEWKDFSRYTARKVYETFKQIGANCDIKTSATITNAIADKMDQFDPDPANKIKLETMIYSFTKFAEKAEDMAKSEQLAKDLKYTKEEKVDLDELYRMKMSPIREAAEENMVPGDYDDPPLAPNGDILDDAWDEVDEDYYNNSYKNEDHAGAYLISEEEFMNDINGNDKESINYYAGDDILLDEDEEIMDKNLVGVENLENLVKLDVRVIFVRNDAIMTDYEILYNEGPAFMEDDT